MRLRSKVTAIILLTWALMFIGVYLGSRYILERTYIQLEDQQATDNLNRALRAIDQMAEGVGLIASSNAVWNDAYQFVQDKNQTFINANLQLSSLVGFGTDMLLFFNSSGQPVYFAVLNQENTAIIPLPQGFDKYLTQKSKLVYQPNVDSSVQGLVSIPSGILVAAAHAIVKGDNTGPVEGTLIAVKYFDGPMLEKLKEVTKLNILIYRSREINNNPEFDDIFKLLVDHPGPILIKNNKILYGYVLLRDIDNNPFGILKVTMARTIYAIGMQSIRYFSIAFLGAGLIFLFLLLYFFRQLVTNRLEQLNKQVVEIGQTKEFTKRLIEEGTDELTSVEIETNKMLDIIQSYTAQQKQLLNQITEASNLVTKIINAMPSILIITDEKLNIMRLNSLAEKELQSSTAEATGKNMLDVFPFLKEYKNKFRDSLDNNVLQAIDKVIHNYNSETIYYSVVIYPLISADKKYLVTRIDDITERVRLAETLSQSEKLASIGVLTAGVAHEINNPINFVLATAEPLQEDFDTIIEILKKYLKLNSAADFEQAQTDINKYKADVKIDYTIEEVGRLLEGIKEGALRTASIVRDLKSFSRLDEDAMKKSDLHEGLNSTLTLLKHYYHGRINIIKDYGQLPEVDCYPGKINQVFMNIISNAIDAISNEGEIKITTRQQDDNVVISIKDSGIGMNEEAISHIFEPFYTTKEVGKGTGLGLSISFGIISDHHGTIAVRSQKGEGTEFIITLPIDQKDTLEGV